tara:strand:+ start:279 stop:665 length:387 start_codon:yes stop_codon:yes gene_type:complete
MFRILLILLLSLIALPVNAEKDRFGNEDKTPNIIQCFSCYLKKFSDWTWEQEKRLGKREDPKYVTCRRYKRKTAKSGEQVCIYKGANNTYTLVVEGQCPNEYQCKYDPHGKEPNIDSVVDSLNDSFKK